MWHDSFIRDMIISYHKTHSMWHDSFLVCAMTDSFCDMTHCMCDMTHSLVTWLYHIIWLIRCDMTHSLCVTWLFHSVTWLIYYVTWLIHSWHDYIIWHDSFEVTWLVPCVWHDWLILWHDSFYVWHDLYSSRVPWHNTWYDTYVCHSLCMTWLILSVTWPILSVTWLIHSWMTYSSRDVTQYVTWHICV